MEEYLNETYIKNYPRPYNEVKRSIFMQECYQKYWAKKILNEYKYYKYLELYLEDLIDDITEGMCSSTDSIRSWIYSVGYDVVLDVLDWYYKEDRLEETLSKDEEAK